MHSRISIGTLSIDPVFHAFVENDLLPEIDMPPARFWSGLHHIVTILTPINRHLLHKRHELQERLDEYHRARAGKPWNREEYDSFLEEIGYIAKPGSPFEITTANVDREISSIAGPQLVVPVNNARFALNAANARWGSLYDALYGTDVIDSEDGKAPGTAYNHGRGAAVMQYSARFLDRAIPLTRGGYADVAQYRLDTSGDEAICDMLLLDESSVALADPDQFVGYRKSGAKLTLLFRNNGLHIEIKIDPEHPIGKMAVAHVADIMLESAVTTIQDFEDSVTAVDATDKVLVYRNWFGLMHGTLEARFTKNGNPLVRRLNQDREYVSVDGQRMTLPGRSLLLVRNVGHLMTTDAVIDDNGNEIYEGILDAIISVACSISDLLGKAALNNSRTGSIYIVKPKMHGPEEVAYTDQLMSMVEDLFKLERFTIKIGIMDEERRTTVNLHECVRAVKDRLVFINTGFLDRTGDEIHTSMYEGPMLPKETIKTQPWILAYEDWNVDIGIRCGLPGKAQIGKGMWPKTDAMREMMETKQAHPEAGANCAWVPSPTAATLHAMHYHYVDVADRQQDIARRAFASIEEILTPPTGKPRTLTAEQIQSELDNNAQGILGYVVRWIDQGIGCSRVPDINGIGLMEDRATLRISSQHIANWLLHGVCTEAQVRETLKRMAKVVDEQNSDDPDYSPMAAVGGGSIAFDAASDLVFKGLSQPNGYTEPLLHNYRKQKKQEIER